MHSCIQQQIFNDNVKEQVQKNKAKEERLEQLQSYLSHLQSGASEDFTEIPSEYNLEQNNLDVGMVENESGRASNKTPTEIASFPFEDCTDNKDMAQLCLLNNSLSLITLNSF